MTLRTALLALALVAAVPGILPAAEPLWPAEPEAAEARSHPAGGPEVTVTVTRGAAGLEIKGRTRLRAMPAAAWAVLTDYDEIQTFVSSMRESRVTGHDGDDLLVTQSAVGRLFLFSRRMRTVLRVHEEPPGVIRFEDVLGRDFVTYRGEWRIEDHGNEVGIAYRLTAQPSFSVPDMVARGAFRRAVRDLISQVGAEIERRAELAGVRGLEGG